MTEPYLWCIRRIELTFYMRLDVAMRYDDVFLAVDEAKEELHRLMYFIFSKELKRYSFVGISGFVEFSIDDFDIIGSAF